MYVTYYMIYIAIDTWIFKDAYMCIDGFPPVKPIGDEVGWRMLTYV